MPTINEIKKMEKVWLYPKHPSNKTYKGYYPVAGIRQVARDIKEFMPDLPLELTLGTAAKESTLAKFEGSFKQKYPNLANDNRYEDEDEYLRWYAQPWFIKQRVEAVKHPKYHNLLNNALDRYLERVGADEFLNNKAISSGGKYKTLNNTQIRDRNIANAIIDDPILGSLRMSARLAGMKLREGMQKYKGDLNKTAQWYNTGEPDRAERVLDLGRTALSHPEVRRILKEEGLLE